MKILRQFSEEMEARHACAFLRSEGVPAAVVGDHLRRSWGVMMTYPIVSVDLVLLDVSKEAEAERLLEELREHPRVLDDSWERALEPDLSRLDPSVTSAACVGCGWEFPLDGTVGTCDKCGLDLDMVECILGSHGPDALADCFPEQ